MPDHGKPELFGQRRNGLVDAHPECAQVPVPAEAVPREGRQLALSLQQDGPIEPEVSRREPHDLSADLGSVDTAIDHYLELGKAIDGLLYMQMELDVASLETAIGRTLPPGDQQTVLSVQASACRRALLWMVMTNPSFVETLPGLSSSGAKKVAAAAAMMA